MGIFDKRFSNSENTTSKNNVFSEDEMKVASKGISLNLSKNCENALEYVHIGAGWDFKGGSSFDLDLCAYLMDEGNHIINTIYYAHKKEHGIYLDKDDLTGASSNGGDDENIFIDLNKLNKNIVKIAVGVVIYRGYSKCQYFSEVKNAYVRFIDEKTKNVLCKYPLSENGGKDVAVIVGDLTKDFNGDWSFTGIEEYYQNESIESLKRYVK